MLKRLFRCNKRALLVVVILYVLFGLWGYCQLEAYCVLFPSIDTVYAEGYSEEGFAQLRHGMAADEVRQLVGEPLGVTSREDGSEEWSYSHDGRCWFGDFAWLDRSLVLREGQVRSIEKRIYYD